MMKLTNSRVVFDKERHTYHLDGHQLQGITGMLHRRLFPSEYANIPQEVLDNAARRGSAIHDACEAYDNGEQVYTEYIAEVDAYAEATKKKKLRHLASEYLVTDGDYFASAIDKVFVVDDHTVDLGDIKTTSKLNKEYVAWQLSIYAYLFESQNPEIKVRHLYAIHIRDGKCKVVKVERIADAKVIALMADEIFDAPVVVETPSLPAMPSQYKEMQWDIREMMEFYVETKEKLDAIKARLLEEMDAAEVTKWQGDMLTFTRKADATCEEFDKKRFKEDHPDLYREYTMITNRRGSVQITINK
mgnify:CR=1 FL=1